MSAVDPRRSRWLVTALISLAALSTTGIGQRGRATPVTFTRDIAPILFARCASCHRPQGVAPFSLLTYDAARSRARLIADVTKMRLMPPWKADPDQAAFVGHVHLTEAEITRIDRWAAAGAPEGRPEDLPRSPVWSDGWQLGVPDLVVALPTPFVVPAAGADFSRLFVIRLPVAAPTHVKGLEFQPGTAGVIHHANIRIDATGRSRELVEQAPASGYSGLLPASAVYPDGHFLGWTPGQLTPLLPKGLSWTLNPGTDLVIEIHFVPSGREQTIQPHIGLYFTADPPARVPALLRLGRQTIDIPEGEPRYVSTDSFVLPVDVDVQALQPHAHYRARSVTAHAVLPDGRTTPLIAISDWDYRWQHVYRYVTPVSLPRGTRIDLQYVFDNSAANPRNPYQPPRRVHWGQRSSDEMGDLWVQMLTRTDEDLQRLRQAVQRKHVAEEIPGYETMIRDDPSSVALHNDVAVLYTQSGAPDKAAGHLETVLQLQPDSPSAHYNLGTALSMMGKVSEAAAHYLRALTLKPDYAAAHNNLGQTLLALGTPDDAEHHFREAARLEPANASAHYNLALVARARGNRSEALERLEQAVALQPDFVPAVANLAWMLATAPAGARRDVARALTLAQHATRLTDRDNATVLDVLAAAQAAGGDFDAAVRTGEEALRLAADGPLKDALQQRVALYRQRHPPVPAP
jgi:tetratricopeptide (TPR) repeat protein